MLNTFRTKIKFWSHVFLWPVIVSFIAFYGWSFLDRPEETSAAAVIGDTEISWRDVVETRQQLHRYYRQMYQENFDRLAGTLDFNEMAREQLINRALLTTAANDFHVTVSQQEVQNNIAAIPAFQRNGTFSPSAYQQTLARMGMTPAQYEASVADDIRLEKTRTLISSAAPVTEDELKERFIQQNVKINCDYIQFTMPQFKEKVTDDPAAVEAYYSAHLDEFRVGDQVMVEYVQFDPKQYEKDVELFDEDIEDYYDRNFEKYQVPEKIRASHILINVESDADEATEAAAKEKILAALTRVQNGDDFAEVAKAVSECPSSSSGGDLGFFQKGRMDPAFEQAAFKLEVGELTQEPVRSRFGWHIIKKTEYQEASWKPLEEVKKEIEKQLREEESKILVMKAAQHVFDKVEPGVSRLSDLVKDKTLVVQTSEFFEPGVPPRVIGYAQNLQDILSNLEEGEISIPVETISGVFLFQLKATKASFIPPFEDVKDDALTKYRNHAASELAQAEAEKVRQAILAGKSWEEAVTEFSAESKNTGDFTRGLSIPSVGGNEEIINELFELDAGAVSPVYEIRKNGVLFRLASRNDFDQDAFEKEIPRLRQQVLRSRENEIVSTWLEQMKTELAHEGRYQLNSLADLN
ncbi:SurA N-terminal domain-containing protein [bacterium]|nr:SurA N-terminal domain-containing protein [candidate division CSSED10-310 bacterium]